MKVVCFCRHPKLCDVVRINMLIQYVCKHRLVPLITDRVPFFAGFRGARQLSPQLEPPWTRKMEGKPDWNKPPLNQNQTMVKQIHKVLKIVDESQQTWKDMTNVDKNTYLHSGKSPHCLSSFNWSHRWSSMLMWWKHFKTCNFCMLTQECKRYLIHEKPSAVVSIDAYLSGPIPIYSHPVLYLFVSAYIDLSLHVYAYLKKCDQYQHCKNCNCCTAKFKRTRKYEVRSPAFPNS